MRMKGKSLRKKDKEAMALDPFAPEYGTETWHQAQQTRIAIQVRSGTMPAWARCALLDAQKGKLGSWLHSMVSPAAPTHSALLSEQASNHAQVGWRAASYGRPMTACSMSMDACVRARLPACAQTGQLIITSWKNNPNERKPQRSSRRK